MKSALAEKPKEPRPVAVGMLLPPFSIGKMKVSKQAAVCKLREIPGVIGVDDKVDRGIYASLALIAPEDRGETWEELKEVAKKRHNGDVDDHHMEREGGIVKIEFARGRKLGSARLYSFVPGCAAGEFGTYVDSEKNLWFHEKNLTFQRICEVLAQVSRRPKVLRIADAAFEELGKMGFSTSAGTHDCNQCTVGAYKSPRAHYLQQERDAVMNGGDLYIRFGPNDSKTGQIVADAFKAAGAKVFWNGSGATKIVVRAS